LPISPPTVIFMAYCVRNQATRLLECPHKFCTNPDNSGNGFPRLRKGFELPKISESPFVPPAQFLPSPEIILPPPIIFDNKESPFLPPVHFLPPEIILVPPIISDNKNSPFLPPVQFLPPEIILVPPIISDNKESPFVPPVQFLPPEIILSPPTDNKSQNIDNIEPDLQFETSIRSTSGWFENTEPDGKPHPLTSSDVGWSQRRGGNDAFEALLTTAWCSKSSVRRKIIASSRASRHRKALP